MHALIIEDEFFIVLAVVQALKEIGFTSFDDANCVAGAIAAANRRRPDLIVANHRLIDGTGTEAVRSICAGQGIAVVFVTASAADVKAGLPDAIVVSKPFEASSLHVAVKQAQQNPLICRQPPVQ